MSENPVLEDAVDTASKKLWTAESVEGGDSSMSARPRRRWSRSARTSIDTTAEVKADSNSNDAVNDFDWEGYLDNQAAAAPMPSYKSNNEDLSLARVDADPGDLAGSITSSGSSSSPRSRGKRTGSGC